MRRRWSSSRRPPRHSGGGRERDAAHIAGAISRSLGRLGRNEEAAERLRAALEILGADRLDAEVGALNCALGRALAFGGHYDEAAPAFDASLGIAQALELPPLISEALTYRGISYLQQSRVEEARGLLLRPRSRSPNATIWWWS